MKDINILNFLKVAKTSDFQLSCGMPLGYVSGLPIVSIQGGKVCLKVPFLKYKVTGEVDKTLVYPVKYVITYSIPSMLPVGFEDLSYNEAFRKVNFNEPIGFFRHDAIKTLDKMAYKKKKEELLSMYDKLASALVNNTAYSLEEETAFKDLLGMMLEPSVKPIYQVIDKKFYDKFLA